MSTQSVIPKEAWFAIQLSASSMLYGEHLAQKLAIFADIVDVQATLLVPLSPNDQAACKERLALLEEKLRLVGTNTEENIALHRKFKRQSAQMVRACVLAKAKTPKKI